MNQLLDRGPGLLIGRAMLSEMSFDPCSNQTRHACVQTRESTPTKTPRRKRTNRNTVQARSIDHPTRTLSREHRTQSVPSLSHLPGLHRNPAVTEPVRMAMQPIRMCARQNDHDASHQCRPRAALMAVVPFITVNHPGDSASKWGAPTLFFNTIGTYSQPRNCYLTFAAFGLS